MAGPALPTPGANDVWGTQLNTWLTTSSSNVVNVKLSPYGAVGDGSDATSAVTAAIAAAGTNGVVYFPPGVYTINGQLTIASGQQWIGAAPFSDATSSSQDSGSKLVFTGSHAGSSCISSNGVAISHASLSDLTIDCTGTYDYIFNMKKPVAFNVYRVQASCTGTSTGGWFSTNSGAGQTWLQNWVDFEIAIPVNSTAYALDCDFSDSAIIGGKFVGGKGAIYRGTAGVKNTGVFFSTGQTTYYAVTISNETTSGSAHSFVGCEFDSLVGNPNAGAYSNAILVTTSAANPCIPMFVGNHIRSAPSGSSGVEVTLTNTSGSPVQGPTFIGNSFVTASTTRLSWTPSQWTGVTFGPHSEAASTSPPLVSQGSWTPVTLGQSGASSSITSGTVGTTETVLATIAVPAGLLQANGQLEIETLWSRAGSTATATGRVRFGGTGITGSTFLSEGLSTSEVSARFNTLIANANSASSQVGGQNGAGSTVAGVGGSYGQNTLAQVTSSVNTGLAQNVYITGQLGTAVAGDTLTLLAYRVVAFPQP